jgi:cyclopropane-fatty-acyl-phospholipid synthase
MTHDTQQHYDLEVQFFKAFLDPYMKYSCGLWERGDNFASAAVRMLDRLIDEAKLPEKPRVLEIGPGWGSLIKRLQHRGIPFEYVGVSPSPVQNAYIKSEFGMEPITGAFEEVAEQLVPRSFDAIFAMGAWCHLKDKLQRMEDCAGLLKPSGRLLIEDTFFLSERVYQEHRDHPLTKFVQQEVFGFAQVDSLPSHFENCNRAGLRVVSTLDHTSSYVATIDEWQKRLSALEGTYPQIPKFQKYLGVFQRGWGYTIVNHLVVHEVASRPQTMKV